jgi:hypothetical protein
MSRIYSGLTLITCSIALLQLNYFREVDPLSIQLIQLRRLEQRKLETGFVTLA